MCRQPHRYRQLLVLGSQAVHGSLPGVYADGISLTEVALPKGWEGRLRSEQIADSAGADNPVTLLFPEVHDLCASKLTVAVTGGFVGGYAVALHGHPRYTADLDVWILLEPANVDAVLAALRDFGFVDTDLTRADFLQEDRVVQLGYPPLRIALLTSLDGVNLEGCYGRRVTVEIGGVEVPFIDRDDLRRNERAVGHHQDLADLEALDGD